MVKIMSVFLISLCLSGCAALEAVKALSGGTSSKGHGNDNTALIGSDVSNGISTGGDIEMDNKNVGGDVTAGNKKSVVAASGNINITEGIPWWVWVLISLLIPSPVEKLYRRIEATYRNNKDDG